MDHRHGGHGKSERKTNRVATRGGQAGIDDRTDCEGSGRSDGAEDAEGQQVPRRLTGTALGWRRDRRSNCIDRT